MRHILAVSFVAFLVAACKMSVLNPPVGPGTDYPCGIHGIQCPDQKCCWENDVCGGQPFSGCPADYCCYVGPDDDSLGGAVKKGKLYSELSPDQMLRAVR